MPSTESVSDDDQLALYAEELIGGLVAHVPGWVERTLSGHLGRPVEPHETPSSAIDRALSDVAVLLRTDIDRQHANPLAIVRSLVEPMTDVLRRSEAAMVPRDPDAVRLFPNDHFDLTPGAFSDVHPELHLPGLTWGAAKAHVHLQRRRTESG